MRVCEKESESVKTLNEKKRHAIAPVEKNFYAFDLTDLSAQPATSVKHGYAASKHDIA